MSETDQPSIAVQPLTRHIGALIDGIDLTRPLGATQVAELRRALLAHQVIFFRNQPISLDQHLALGRHFGSLHVHPNSPGPEGYPEILQIHADENTRRIAGDRWHSDVSCDVEPPMGSILHLHTLPSHGGDTLFSSAYAVYESLSPGFRRYLEGLSATHDGEPTYRQRNRLRGIDDTGRRFPKASHPVVRTHPETGRKGVFVNANFTTHIDNVPAAESEGILRLLFERFAAPEYQVRWRWEPHSIAFWDNRACQHLAVWDYYPEVRSGYRVTISGDKPYL
ncbi:taurine dioxygenase [Paraburkholderia youngii]|uniref:Taurine dioxygenase n=1 Tax=Paraburkholderia youngii TaxID=2782701 RepID=A0A7Y6K4Z9_9BURK|nr:TauD/TfdA family dioxygenase [Paraburkholderia youngii]NUY04465.1 taurine dioxygenase [Paraburkholderia youngii]NVH74173.1 taurine dioxygenase [Paraburkholderia youngii]